MRLRPVRQTDLPVMFVLQQDPESNRLAVTYPRTESGFQQHWMQALSDPTVTARAILSEDLFVGWIAVYPSDGLSLVGYWLGREFWGRGIASRALMLLLNQVRKRPLFARVAVSNGASVRVLQKCGFQIAGYRDCPEDDRYPACEEVILSLEDFTGGSAANP
ncbi:MAG: GNAT family N-acetyltransferase [Planctomyces sp.]|nr:GNAT family N-acetyltransferase [Planctomyces sp.]